MSTRWIAAAGATAAVAVAAAVVMSSWTSTPAAAPEAGGGARAGACDAQAKPAPLDFTLKDMHGADVDLSAYRGQVVLLNFWATWCGPCKYEIPAFVELQDKYRDEGFIALGVSTDDPPDALRQFAEQYQMNYPVLVGRDHRDIMRAYGPLWAIPVSFFISRDGTICRRHMGLATKEQFEEIIRSLL